MYENEVLALLLGTGVLMFITLFRKQLQRLPASHWLFAAYIAAWCGWAATVLEHVFWHTAFNIIEHGAYAANGLLLFCWCVYAMNGTSAVCASDDVVGGRGAGHD